MRKTGYQCTSGILLYKEEVEEMGGGHDEER
jgi:hypothetical protein